MPPLPHTGNQGNQWKQAAIDIPEVGFTLVFEAVRGDSYLGDIAIDDVTIPLCTEDNSGCLSNPCQNEGTCTDGNNDYTCTCKNGYTGKNCQTGMSNGRFRLCVIYILY